MGMSVTEIFRVEVVAFFAALVLLLGHRMATGQISLSGLFGSAEGVSKINPERVLLFVASLVMGAVYIVQMMLGGVSALPNLSAAWVVMFGVSCLIYLCMKAFRTFGRKS
jgi:hypothetical protein